MPDEWEAFRKIIVEEMELFNLVNLGGKRKWCPTGVFSSIGDGKFWIYYHPAHVKMSSITLGQMLDYGIISDITEIESATCICGTHDELQSFFYDNSWCFIYANEVRCQSHHRTIEKFLNYVEPHENMPFKTPSLPDLSTLLFQEDDWTKRLSNSIPLCLKR